MVGFKQDLQKRIFAVISAILLLGNVEFVKVSVVLSKVVPSVNSVYFLLPKVTEYLSVSSIYINDEIDTRHIKLNYCSKYTCGGYRQTSQLLNPV